MKAISIGSRYEIYDDTLKAYDQLPAKTYTVRFNKMSGFYLEARADLSVNEKVYGVHPEKAEKVLRSFKLFERNLGVILSGSKGIGKSLFARLLSEEAVKAGYPVIIVDQAIPGIAAYIESIEQEAVFLFDEFDKTFGGGAAENDLAAQTGLLSLFDGTSQGKKLFIITCNELFKINEYMVNRPGRFHYHFRFDYPEPADIRAYLNDKLGEEYQTEIDKVVMFSTRVALNYDCLRAISFELRQGAAFEDAIRDLNIINNHSGLYNAVMHFVGGRTLSAKRCHLDLFNSEEKVAVYLCDEKGRNLIDVRFRPADCIYDPKTNSMTIHASNMELDYPDDYGEEMQEETMKMVPEYLTITRATERDIHYLPF